MAVVSKRKPYRVGRSRTGLGLFATEEIAKGTRIVEYFGPLLDCSKPKHDAIENKYLFELNGRWTIDGSVRRNIARYANHGCRPNAESDVHPRLKKVYIRAIKKIRPGDEITYDYGTDYFREYLKPIGCRCASCETRRKAARAEERARKKRAAARRQKRALNGQLLKGQLLKGQVFKGQVFKGQVFKGQVFKGQVFKGQVFDGHVLNGNGVNGHAAANGKAPAKRSRRAGSAARH